MKFAKKTEQEHITKKTKIIKYYFCPICGYTVITSEFNGKTVREVGEKDFILFPFSSLATLKGGTVEYCACPSCDAIQTVNYCSLSELEELIQRDNCEYVN